MRVPPFARNILIGLGSVAAFVSIVVAIVFQATSGLTKVADNFFDALKEGDTDKALNYFSGQALNQTSSSNLDDFRFDNSLADLKSLSWSNRSISIPDGGELIGTLHLKNGQNIPLTLSFKKNGDDWKIYSIKQNSAGIVNTAAGEELPNEEKLIRIARTTTSRFVESIVEDSFVSFYKTISNRWSQETSAEELSGVFKQFRQVYKNNQASHQYFKSLLTMQPIFAKQPTINGNGFLVVSGKYDIKPEFTFVYQYVYEGLSWKLAGIQVKF